MQCPRCNAHVDDESAFCGNCGRQMAPLQAQGPTVVKSIEGELNARTILASKRQTAYPAELQWLAKGAATQTPAEGNLPQPPANKRSRLPNLPRLSIIAALALIVFAGATVGLLATLRNAGAPVASGAKAAGQVAFIDNPGAPAGHSDALNMSIQGLQAPPAGSQYDAWLINTQSERIIALGVLKANGQTYSLSYPGDGSGGQAGGNLLGVGDRIEVTMEQGAVTAPGGKVMLSAVFPPRAFVHIKHLLFSFPITPGKIGLLVGLLDQAQVLNAQSLLLQNAAANHNAPAVLCASQGIIDILEGAQGSAYRLPPQSCASENSYESGDGFGILGANGYVALAAAHASLAANQPDATDSIRLHAGHVEIAMANIKEWAKTVEQDALALRAAPGNTAVIHQIVTLSDHIYHGVDINGNEHVDPVPAEAGAITAYNHGQLMARLQLVASV
jgi:hypothetical protein